MKNRWIRRVFLFLPVLTMTPVNFIYLTCGGAAGTLLRFVTGQWIYKTWSGTIFPWGTLTVNLAGSLLIGMIYGWMEQGNFGMNTRLFIFAGVLGGFTTFSAYSLETIQLFRQSHETLALLNVLANNIGGLLLAAVGFYISKILFAGFSSN